MRPGSFGAPGSVGRVKRSSAADYKPSKLTMARLVAYTVECRVSRLFGRINLDDDLTRKSFELGQTTIQMNGR